MQLSLKLYVFTRVERETSQDYQFPQTGITLFKGQLIHILIYAVQHSQEFYPNPRAFIPERFMREN